jgi:hypothetical protein
LSVKEIETISIYNEIDKDTIKCRQRTARVANKSREDSGRSLLQRYVHSDLNLVKSYVFLNK